MPTPHSKPTPPTPPRQQLDNMLPKMRDIIAVTPEPALKEVFDRGSKRLYNNPATDPGLQSLFDREPKYQP